MISVLADFCISGISIFLQIRNYGNPEIPEIQKSRKLKSCMYVCMQAGMCVCMGMEWSLPQPPFKDPKAYSIINVCVFVNTIQEMDIE